MKSRPPTQYSNKLVDVRLWNEAYVPERTGIPELGVDRLCHQRAGHSRP